VCMRETTTSSVPGDAFLPPRPPPNLTTKRTIFSAVLDGSKSWARAIKSTRPTRRRGSAGGRGKRRRQEARVRPPRDANVVVRSRRVLALSVGVCPSRACDAWSAQDGCRFAPVVKTSTAPAGWTHENMPVAVVRARTAAKRK